MNFSTVFLKVLVPAILCVFIVYISGGNLLLYPFVFGLIVGLANRNLHKYDPFFGCLFSILLSYIVFAIGWFGAGFWKYTLEYMMGNILLKNNISILDVGFMITTYIVAPLLIYLVYKVLFKIPMGKFTILIIIVSIVILVFVDLLPIEDNKNNLINHFNIWQLIVMLSLQFMINQKNILKRENGIIDQVGCNDTNNEI